jgi:hypothetical protein
VPRPGLAGVAQRVSNSRDISASLGILCGSIPIPRATRPGACALLQMDNLYGAVVGPGWCRDGSDIGPRRGRNGIANGENRISGACRSQDRMSPLAAWRMRMGKTGSRRALLSGGVTRIRSRRAATYTVI